MIFNIHSRRQHLNIFDIIFSRRINNRVNVRRAGYLIRVCLFSVKNRVFGTPRPIFFEQLERFVAPSRVRSKSNKMVVASRDKRLLARGDVKP